MFAPPAIRSRTNSTTSGHSASIATEYQKPLPRLGNRAVSATIREKLTP